MEAIGAASAILAIATAGVQCSVKLATFAGQVKTAPEHINMIAEDVSLNASILQQLGALANENLQDEHLPDEKDGEDEEDDKGNTIHNVNSVSKQSIFNKAGLETVMQLARKCEEIFKSLDRSLGIASKQLLAKTGILGKVKLSRTEMFKWPFLLPGIDTMRNELKNVKETLMLMLQVATLAYSRRMMGEYGQNMQRNTAIIAYSRDDQELLIEAIVVAHKAQASKASNIASVRDRPAFTQLSEPSTQRPAMDSRPNATAVSGQNETNPNLENNVHDEPSRGCGCRRRSIATESISISEPSPVQSQIFPSSPSPSPKFSINLMSPRASIIHQKIRVTYDTRSIELPDSTIESQLQEWRSSISRTVLAQMAALSPIEVEALDSAFNLQGEPPEWIQFGDYATLIQGIEDLKARTLTVITKGVPQSTWREEKRVEKKEEKKENDKMPFGGRTFRTLDTEGEVKTIFDRNTADGRIEERQEEIDKMEDEDEQAELEADDDDYNDEYDEQVGHETEDADYDESPESDDAEAIVDALLAKYTV